MTTIVIVGNVNELPGASTICSRRLAIDARALFVWSNPTPRRRKLSLSVGVGTSRFPRYGCWCLILAKGLRLGLQDNYGVSVSLRNPEKCLYRSSRSSALACSPTRPLLHCGPGVIRH